MKKLLVLFAVCSIAASMVPRERRAMNEDEAPQPTPTSTTSTTTTAKPKEICAAQTPCAWIVYNAYPNIPQEPLSNSYCECGPGKSCTLTEDDKAINTYIFHCKVPSENDEIFESS